MCVCIYGAEQYNRGEQEEQEAAGEGEEKALTSGAVGGLEGQPERGPSPFSSTPRALRPGLDQIKSVRERFSAQLRGTWEETKVCVTVVSRVSSSTNHITKNLQLSHREVIHMADTANDQLRRFPQPTGKYAKHARVACIYFPLTTFNRSSLLLKSWLEMCKHRNANRWLVTVTVTILKLTRSI